jgi:hypothetical protein
MFIIDPLLITILINQNQVLGRKNKITYRPPEINKGESPKYCSYCKKNYTFFQNVLKRNNKSALQGSIACTALKDPLMPILIEKSKFKYLKISV